MASDKCRTKLFWDHRPPPPRTKSYGYTGCGVAGAMTRLFVGQRRSEDGAVLISVRTLGMADTYIRLRDHCLAIQ